MLYQTCSPMPKAILPEPNEELKNLSRELCALICAEMAETGFMPFSRFMELALYQPGLGYYSAGARKLGADGDFTTAPEMSPLFGQVLARQVQQLFEQVPSIVLEVGAGSGALAASLLAELEKRGALPDQYWILELSADLRQRERDTLAERVPHLMERVAFLATGDRIEVGDLAFILSPTQDPYEDLSDGVGLAEASNRFQREYIKRAVKRMKGNMSDAAEFLGLHRSNLYRKMRQLGMEVEEVKP